MGATETVMRSALKRCRALFLSLAFLIAGGIGTGPVGESLAADDVPPGAGGGAPKPAPDKADIVMPRSVDTAPGGSVKDDIVFGRYVAVPDRASVVCKECEDVAKRLAERRAELQRASALLDEARKMYADGTFGQGEDRRVPKDPQGIEFEIAKTEHIIATIGRQATKVESLGDDVKTSAANLKPATRSARRRRLPAEPLWSFREGPSLR